jgi:hypothetical protein
MAEADRQALTAFLSDADRHCQAFEEGQPATATPWPYALLEWSPEDQAPPSVQQVLAVVRTNTASLRVIVHERGWPGRSVVGEDGADAAWLVLQHAGSGVASIGTPENHEFRRACVPLLEHAVQEGEAHPRHLASTVDGIRSVAGEPPVFAVLTTDYTNRLREALDDAARTVQKDDLHPLVARPRPGEPHPRSGDAR